MDASRCAQALKSPTSIRKPLYGSTTPAMNARSAMPAMIRARTIVTGSRGRPPPSGLAPRVRAESRVKGSGAGVFGAESGTPRWAEYTRGP